MAHRVVIMQEQENTPREEASEGGHGHALNLAATEIASVGARFFRAVKSQMIRDMQAPEDLKELGESQFLVLHALVRGPHLSSELARLHNVTNPTMTRVVDGLVEKGYVARRNDPEDRRCVFLELTEQGRDVGQQAQEHFREVLVRYLSPLSSEQLADIVRAYRHLSSLLPEGSNEQENSQLERMAISRRPAHNSGFAGEQRTAQTREPANLQ